MALRIGQDAWGVIASFLLEDGVDSVCVLDAVCKGLLSTKYMERVKEQVNYKLATNLYHLEFTRRQQIHTRAFVMAKYAIEQADLESHPYAQRILLRKGAIDLLGRYMCAIEPLNVNIAVECGPGGWIWRGDLSLDPDFSICEWNDLKMRHREFMEARGFVRISYAGYQLNSFEQFTIPIGSAMIDIRRLLIGTVLQRVGVSFTSYENGMCRLLRARPTVRVEASKKARVRKYQAMWTTAFFGSYEWQYRDLVNLESEYRTQEHLYDPILLPKLEMRFYNRKQSKHTRIYTADIQHNQQAATHAQRMLRIVDKRRGNNNNNNNGKRR